MKNITVPLKIEIGALYQTSGYRWIVVMVEYDPKEQIAKCCILESPNDPTAVGSYGHWNICDLDAYCGA